MQRIAWNYNYLVFIDQFIYSNNIRGSSSLHKGLRHVLCISAWTKVIFSNLKFREHFFFPSESVFPVIFIATIILFGYELCYFNNHYDVTLIALPRLKTVWRQASNQNLNCFTHTHTKKNRKFWSNEVM